MENALTDPPDGIRNKLKTTRVIEFVCCSNETDIPLVNQINQRHSLMLILFGNRNDETQIGCHKFLFCLFTFLSPISDSLG